MKKQVIVFSSSIVLLVILLAVQMSCKMSKEQRIIDTYWYYLPSPWKNLEGSEGEKYAFASILVFSKDGTYSRVVCELSLKNNKVFITWGDGWDIYQGTWSWKGDNLLIKSRLWYAMNAPLGYKYPTQDTEEIGIIDSDSLTLGKDKYTKGLLVDEKDVNYLINGAKTARKK